MRPTIVEVLSLLRSGEWSELEVLGRQRHDSWRREGSPTVVERAGRVARGLGGAEGAQLEPEARRRIRDIIGRYERSHRPG